MGAHRSLPNNYTSDWTSGLGADWANINSTNHSVVDHVGVKHLRLINAYRVMPRFVIGSSASFDVTTDIVITKPTSGEHSFVLYSGEWNYCGLYFDTLGRAFVHDLSPGSTSVYQYVKTAGWYASGDTINLKIAYDVTAKTTKLYLAKNGGALELVWTRTSIAGGGASSEWPAALSLWISGTGNSNFDIGPVSIVRDSPRTILAGCMDYYGVGYQWNNTLQTVDWTEWLSYYGAAAGGTGGGAAANIPHIWDSAEGDEQPGGLMPMAVTNEDQDEEFLQGSFTLTSGAINRGSLAFGTIGLYGYQGPVGEGTVRVRILGTTQTLISDAIIPNNSTGFLPTGGAFTPLNVDISAVTDETIYLEMYISYTGTSAVKFYENLAPWVYAPTLFGFTVEDGPLQLLMEPATTTPMATSATMTGILVTTSATATPTGNSAHLVGVLPEALATATPIAASGQLVGALTTASASVTPQATSTTLVGILPVNNIATTPTSTVATLGSTTPQSGSGSIRSPSGEVLQQYNSDGIPLTTFRYVSGTWQ